MTDKLSDAARLELKAYRAARYKRKRDAAAKSGVHHVAYSLRRIRKFHGISMDRLARKSGHAISQISRFERGISDLRIEVIDELLEALGYELRIVKKGPKRDDAEHNKHTFNELRAIEALSSRPIGV